MVWVLATVAACTSETTAERPALTVDLWLGGDVHIAGTAAGTNTADRLAPLSRHLAGAIGIVNLEGPVGVGESQRDTLFNAAEALPVLAERGVAVVSVVNNHTLDHGPDGVRHTLAALDRAGITPAGDVSAHTSATANPDDGIAIIAPAAGRQRRGVRIATVAHDLSAVSGDSSLTGIRSNIERSIARARTRADIVVVAFHVVAPPSYIPSRELVAAVDLAVERGAHVVVAHGSHALARVERRDGSAIIWGLGNLVFDCACTREQDALLARVTVARDGVRAARVIPIDAGLHGRAARPAAEAELTLDLLESLGSTALERDNGAARFF